MLNKVTSIIIALCFVCSSYGRIPNTRLCGDEKCERIISMAKTLMHFNSADSGMISFRGNLACRVMSKSVGENSDLWEIEVQGRRGYAPKKMVMEQKILIKKTDLIEVHSEPMVNKPAKLESTDEKPISNEVGAENVSETIGLSHEPIDSARKNEQETPIDVIVESETLEVEAAADSFENLEPNINENTIESTDEKPNLNELGAENVSETFGLPHEPIDIEGKNEQYTSTDVTVKPETLEIEANADSFKNLDPITNEVNSKGDQLELQDVRYLHAPNESNANEEGSGEVFLNDHNDVEKKMEADAEAEKSVANADEQGSVPINLIPVIEPLIEKRDIYITGDVEEARVIETQENEHVRLEVIGLTDSTEQSSNINRNEDEVITTSKNNNNHNELDEDQKITTSKNNNHNAFDEDLGKVEATTTTEFSEESEETEIPEANNHEATENDSDYTSVESENITESPMKIEIMNSSDSSDILNNKSSENINNPEPTDEFDDIAKSPVEASTNLVDEINQSELLSEERDKQFDNIEQDAYAIDEQLNTNQFGTSEESTQIPIIEKSESEEGMRKNVDVRTDDIFSPNYKPETPKNVVSEDEGESYLSVIWTALEDKLLALQNVFNSISFEKDINSIPRKNIPEVDMDGYCDNLQDSSCSNYEGYGKWPTVKNTSYDQYAKEFLAKVVAMADLVVFLLLTASTILIFIFGHYCLVNNRKENALLFKLNNLERNLQLSQKECSVVRTDLAETQKKLNSIADKSFGADDMIKQFEVEKTELHEQISSLEKELETAAEAGLELNKMVSELLSNQSGSDSIISSVEELQQQLNEQEATTIYINNLLAEKSRENSELQVLLSDTNQKFGAEIQDLLTVNENLKVEKESIEIELKNFGDKLKKELDSKSNELDILNESYMALKKEYSEGLKNWKSCASRAEALEETLQKLDQFKGNDDIKSIIEITDFNAKYKSAEMENETLREQLEAETEVKLRTQHQIKEVTSEIDRLREELNRNEREKLEAQTRLEVLSSYFKDKESQLQKELSVKEALFMQQQGESTSTVERIRSLQDDMQSLRSQNDELRAEIEAAAAAHKAQINAAEVRAHDSWLSAKQAERRLEESRAEASTLRKKLTSLTVNGNSTETPSYTNRNPLDGFTVTDVNAPSPIHLESPVSPIMNLNLPPPPMMPATMFNAGMVPSFMPLPPLPLSGEMQMRPAPLGRLMSPPPPPPDHYMENFAVEHRYDNGRYSPDDRDMYETETDFSPPRTPPGMYERDYRNYSPDASMRKKGSSRKGSNSYDYDSDEWERQTY